MPTNDFKPFSIGVGANVITQAAYAVLAALTNGFSAGIATSAQLNKVWRQASVMASIMGDYIVAQLNVNVVDDGNTATLLTQLTNAFAAQIGNVGGGFFAFAGNPNTHVAGRAGIAGTNPPDLCEDTTNGDIYVCTTTGIAALAVWTKVTPAPTALFGGGTVERLTITNNGATPNTKIDAASGPLCMVNASGAPFAVASLGVTVDLTTVGLNGMDTGARPTSGWVYLFAVSNGVTTGVVASTSATSPTMPGGYTYKKYLGAMRCDGSQNLLRHRQRGNISTYVVTPATNTAALPQIASGTTGAPGTPTFTAVSLASTTPASALETLITAANTSSNTNLIIAPNANYGAASSTTNPPWVNVGMASAGATMSYNFLLPNEDGNLYWASTGTASINVAGWVDFYV